jgi:hypothetical protein
MLAVIGNAAKHHMVTITHYDYDFDNVLRMAQTYKTTRITSSI